MAELTPTVKVSPTRVTVGFSYKQQTQQFESAEVSIGVEDDRWENEKVRDTINRLWKLVRDEVTEKSLEVKEEFK